MQFLQDGEHIIGKCKMHLYYQNGGLVLDLKTEPKVEFYITIEVFIIKMMV